MNILKQLYQINSYSGSEDEIRRFVLQQIADLSLRIEVDNYGNVLITKGHAEKYPCLAAHLDEIHLPSVRNLHEQDGNIYALDENGEPVGIGADDKNGVWIVIQLLRQIETMKAVLFVREEKATFEGYRHGSDDCNLTFFNDVGYVLQCDRKGAGDLVTYCTKKEIRLCDDDFVPKWILQKYGYAPVEGGVTDVVHLKGRGLHIPCCNISCGFYNAHQPEEYTNVAELLNCFEFVKMIVLSI